jgi:hypothetical protein
MSKPPERGYLRWPATPGPIAWRSLYGDDLAIHSGVDYQGLKAATGIPAARCGVELAAPLGWPSADVPGLGNVIAFDTARLRPPQYPGDTRARFVCASCAALTPKT